MLVILISKQPDASALKHFKPINLCTTLYKVCARILVGRLKSIILWLIYPEQDCLYQWPQHYRQYPPCPRVHA